MAGNALVDYAVEHLLIFGVQGYAPHSCFVIPFGDINDPQDFFPSTKFGDIKLKLTGESGLGNIRVLTQQIRM